MNPNNQTNGAVPQPPNTQPSEEKPLSDPATAPSVDAPASPEPSPEVNAASPDASPAPDVAIPPQAPTNDSTSSPEVAPVVTPAGSTAPPAGKKSKLLLVIVLIVILLAAAGAGAYFLTQNSSSDSSSAKTSTNKTTNASSANNKTSTVAKSIPGYVTLDKLCYKIQVPKENDAGNENSCLFSARFGSTGTPSINFTYFTKNTESLDVNVAALKESSAKINDTLVSEETVKIGGIESKKLIFKGAGATATETVHYLVPTNKYKVDGVPITGFEIVSSAYDKPENKAIIDNIISTIQWK